MYLLFHLESACELWSRAAGTNRLWSVLPPAIVRRLDGSRYDPRHSVAYPPVPSLGDAKVPRSRTGRTVTLPGATAQGSQVWLVGANLSSDRNYPIYVWFGQESPHAETQYLTALSGSSDLGARWPNCCGARSLPRPRLALPGEAAGPSTERASREAPPWSEGEVA